MSWITGLHFIAAAIERGEPGHLIYAGGHDRARAIVDQARQAGYRVERVSPQKLLRDAGPQARGVAFASASSSITTVQLHSWIQQHREDSRLLILLLDHITDPQNVGAILRSADLFAVDLVVMPSRRAAGLTDAVARTSVGAAQYVPIATVTNMARAVEDLRAAEVWVYAAALDGAAVAQTRIHERCAFVLGAEGEGVAPLVQQRCDERISIETRGHVDSLNVAAAAAILCYEYRRRHTFG